MTNIDELKGVFLQLHGAEAKHLESVSVKETWQGQTVWEGVVEVFDLDGHPNAHKAYAWTHHTDDPENPKRHVTVLHIHPATSPLAAVRAAIARDYYASVQA